MREKLRSIVVGGWNWTRNQDLVVLLLAFTLVSSIWLFVEIADEVREGETETFDNSILKALRSPNMVTDRMGARRVEESVRDITALGSVTVLLLITAVVLAYLAFTRRFNACIFLSLAMGGGLALNWTLKKLFSRPRPDSVTHLHYVDSYSFPSGHTLLSAVVYLTLGALVARMAATRRQKLYVMGAAMLLAFLVGISRVYLGVHHPSDVLAGWAVGLVWAIVCWFIARYLQRRGAVEQPGPPA